MSLSPEVIHITSCYLQDYRCPILRIKVRSDRTQRLKVLKGEEEIVLQDDEDLVSFSYSFIEFPLGYIKEGLCTENNIILKNFPVADNKAIFFDYLELDDQDEDRDWSLDSEECEGDTDLDGREDRDDPDTASIFIQDCDQTIIKRVTLDIQEGEDSTPFFQKLAIIDQNNPAYPSEPAKNVFFPYGHFIAKIMVQIEGNNIPLRVIYPEKLYSWAQFYISYDDGGWQQLPIEMLDENSIILLLEPGSEIQGNDYTEGYKLITIKGGLGYPLEMSNELDDNGCFISSISFNFLTSRLITFCFLLIYFIFNLLLEKCSLTTDKLHYAKDNHFNIFGILKTKKYTKILIVLFCLILRSTLARAIIFPDMQMNSTPNPVGSGARAFRIGNAFIAIADDATAASWNPAALLNLKRPEFSIVGSFLSGDRTFNTSSIEGDVEDFSHDLKHLKYFSLVYPFFLLQRNMVFFVNYQHLYEFYQDSSSP